MEQLDVRVGKPIGAVLESVSETLSTVQQTVHTVKNGVASIRENCDVVNHVQRRPWIAMAGATALGYWGAKVLRNRAARRGVIVRDYARSGSPRGVDIGHLAGPGEANATLPLPVATESRGAQFREMFHEETIQLRGIAMGFLFGVLRDVLLKSVPRPMGPHVGDVIDGVTLRLGATPIPVRVHADRVPARRPRSVESSERPPASYGDVD